MTQKQEFENKMALAYEQILKTKVKNENDFNALSQTMELIMKKSDQVEGKSPNEFKRFAYSVWLNMRKNLYRKEKAYQKRFVVDSQVKSIHADEIEEIKSVIENYKAPNTDKSGRTIRNPDKEVLKVFSGICKRIKDKRLKKVFFLKYGLGLKMKAIAYRCNVSEKTVKRDSKVLETLLKGDQFKDIFEEFSQLLEMTRNRDNTLCGERWRIEEGSQRKGGTALRYVESFTKARLERLASEVKIIKSDNYKRSEKPVKTVFPCFPVELFDPTDKGFFGRNEIDNNIWVELDE